MLDDMDTDSFRSTAPVFLVEDAEVTMLVVVDGQSRREPLHFRASVLWLRNIETTRIVRVSGDGRVLHEGPTTSDRYGYLNSINQVLLDARAQAQRDEFLPGSPVETVVAVTVRDRAVIEPAPRPEDSRMRPGERRFRPCPAEWLRRDDVRTAAYLSSRSDGQQFTMMRDWPSFRTRKTTHTAWSSGWTEPNRAELQALEDRLLEGCPEGEWPALRASLHERLRWSHA